MSDLILIIEDEPKIAKLARDYLERYGYRVLTAADGPTGLAAARRESPDLVLLDLLLPGIDGREVCRRLRADSAVPIIMLTALAEETDQIVGLELGADDYITKPFSPGVLVARVRAALRRVQGDVHDTATLRSGDLVIDPAAHSATLAGRPVHLTPNEFKLLVALARRPGQTLTREQLLDELHGAALGGVDRSVDSHVKNLRRKLERDPDRPLIETVYGVGYRLVEPE
ncbi:MAG: response regulator transcription factor [Anaerolineae bacterium]|nr:response regulator transcription factor [Anaerolineae bacterium]